MLCRCGTPSFEFGVMIYFVQGEITRRIKIGFTTRFIHSRLGSLQIGSPDKLIFRGAHPGDERTEYGLHQRFRGAHSHGEWFHETDDLSQYVSLHCIHHMEIAQSVDSLVSSGTELYEQLLHLDHEEINARYMAYIVKRLR